MDRSLARLAVLLTMSGLLVGCGESHEPTPISQPQPVSRQDTTFNAPERESPPESNFIESFNTTDRFQVSDTPRRSKPNVTRLEIDDATLEATGIRKLTGTRITLYTDLPSSEEVDILPNAFDQAFPQWCEYFNIDPAKHPDWRMTGRIIKDKARFRQAGLLPADLPPFQHGYARDYDLWLNEQPSDYYRRHLLLHEGTHGFMNTLFGGCGPPWYMEGTAELLSTHRWKAGQVTLNTIPTHREEVPMWGRIKLIRKAIAAGRAKRLIEVIEYGPNAHFEVEPYAWCWATAIFLDRHPRYGDRFRRLTQFVCEPDLSERFKRSIGDEWSELNDAWDVHVAGLEFGHDIDRMAIDFSAARPLPNDGATLSIDVARGWQSSGYQLKAETRYEFRASGRYQVADQPKIWWCEPGGVSIRYYQGRPLGVLLAAIRADEPEAGDPNGFLHPIVIGLGTHWTPKQSGTLFLRINDSAGELDDNAGSLTLTIRN